MKISYLEGFDFGVGSHVNVEDGGPGKTFVTVGAHVGTASRVGPQMFL